jgi:hypothetical protein
MVKGKSKTRAVAATSHAAPTAFTGLEVAPIVLEAIKEYGPAFGAAVIAGLKGDQSVFVQCQASWREKGTYTLVLSFRNVAGHGVYVERVSVAQPQGVQMRTWKPSKDISFGADETPARSPLPLPLLLAPSIHSETTIGLELTDNSKGQLGTGYMVTVEYAYTRLDSPLDHPQVGRVNVAIRQTAP